MDLGLEFQKTNISQICPIVDLGLAVQETIVGIRISILDKPCVAMFSQNEQL